MAKIHVMEATGLKTYRIVVHAPTPGGSNPAGVSWATAIQNSGRAFTSMTIGNGAGQITNNEATDIANGTVIEASFDFTDDPNETPAQRNARLDAYATQTIAETQAKLEQALRYFGATRN